MLFDAQVVKTCPCCGHATFVSVVSADYFDWLDGKLIQDAMPYMSTEDRETLISGYCPNCQEAMFSNPWDDEDEEEEYEDEDVSNLC